MSITRVIPASRTVYTEKAICVIECASCAIDFGIGQDFQRRRREDHERFYCPNGHENVYPQESEAERLRRELERQRVRANGEEARRRLAERQRAAAKGQVTRIKNRVSNGVCPCCKRTFQNLGRHMAGQHPDYTQEQNS